MAQMCVLFEMLHYEKWSCLPLILCLFTADSDKQTIRCPISHTSNGSVMDAVV